MIDKIEEAIVSVLRENIEGVPKENIGMRKPDLSIAVNLPAISIVNVEFKIEEIGIGRSFATKNNEVEERFSGDGKRVNYTLSRKPLKPTLIVEHPPGERRLENADYFVDYENGSITFQVPPEEGSNNILVRYLIPAEIKSVKLIMKYHINVWDGDELRANKITFSIIEALLKREEDLNLRGVMIKPTGGFSIPADKTPKGVYGRTIECLLETYMQVETPLPRIEKIEIKQKR
ncbi:MAG: hypothetical protein QXL85_06195 [Candidatus Bathyarchaeia archaeon]